MVSPVQRIPEGGGHAGEEKKKTFGAGPHVSAADFDFPMDSIASATVGIDPDTTPSSGGLLDSSASAFLNTPWKTIFASIALIWYTVLFALSLIGCMTA
jgi:hypothetical protein